MDVNQIRAALVEVLQGGDAFLAADLEPVFLKFGLDPEPLRAFSGPEMEGLELPVDEVVSLIAGLLEAHPPPEQEQEEVQVPEPEPQPEPGPARKLPRKIRGRRHMWSGAGGSTSNDSDADENDDHRVPDSHPDVAVPRENYDEKSPRERKPTAEGVKRKLEDLQSRNVALEREIEEERIRAEELAAKLNKTSRALNEKQSKLSQSEQHIQELEAEKESLGHKVTEISGEMKKNSSVWTDLKATVKETEAQWREQLEETERMTLENTDRLAKDIELQNSLIQNLRTEISDLEVLKVELARKIHDWDHMNSELEQVKETNGELRSQLERFQEQINERTVEQGLLPQAQPLALELWNPEHNAGQLVPAGQAGLQTQHLEDRLEEERTAHQQTREELMALGERIFGLEDALRAQEERVHELREETGFRHPDTRHLLEYDGEYGYEGGYHPRAMSAPIYQSFAPTMYNPPVYPGYAPYPPYPAYGTTEVITARFQVNPDGEAQYTNGGPQRYADQSFSDDMDDYDLPYQPKRSPQHGGGGQSSPITPPPSANVGERPGSAAPPSSGSIGTLKGTSGSSTRRKKTPTVEESENKTLVNRRQVKAQGTTSGASATRTKQQGKTAASRRATPTTNRNVLYIVSAVVLISALYISFGTSSKEAYGCEDCSVFMRVMTRWISFVERVEAATYRFVNQPQSVRR
ncbi:hypothetical protein M427DRAFT_57302 [Gonapodya prolifera JEL478]|uniref:Uncharacterized protein n=1 Tax=Gonapodya prolifera (strain JEL478) TaxID=1344416 RepID=A0A139ADN1_GONPJ|nr:hypothetical protein M427DRAFT_57302 [Gonapodya prolifera JEL478]|eukprot:KXS14901.1 hypothetical protein M427DRAFT_57302 [Gonapodya prolifera JEL478]